MKRRWLVFMPVLLMGVCAATNMTKASPIFLTLIPALGFSEYTIGWMVSGFSIMSLALAFPAGWLIRKLGVRRLLLISGCAGIIGSILGALATDASFMLFSRFIEGTSLGIVVVVGSVAVDLIMPSKIRGLAMGIWVCFFPAGVIISMLVAPTLSNTFGWASVWWFTTVLGLLATVLILVLYAEPKKQEEPAVQELSEAQHSQQRAFLQPDFLSIFFVCIAHFAWNFFWGAGFSSFYPTYLQDALLLSNTTAGLMVAVPNFIIIALSPLAGRLTDYLGSCKWLIAASLLEVIILLFIAFSGILPLAWMFILAVSLAASALPTAVFAIMPKLAKTPEATGIAMGAIVFCAHSAILIGTGIFGSLKAALGGWQETALFFLMPVVVIGFVFSLLIKEKRTKR